MGTIDQGFDLNKDISQWSKNELSSLLEAYRTSSLESAKQMKALSRANAHAAVLVSEVEAKNQQLETEVKKRRDAESELHVMNQKLEQRVLERTKDLEEFIYAVSHDLKEPVRTITSFLQLLERRLGGSLEDSNREFLELAVNGGRRITEMIDGILNYSRVHTTAQDFEDISINEVMERVKKNLTILVRESCATIEITALPQVRADPVQITQVFQNLIQNSIKFHSESPIEISIRCEDQEDHWLFKVIDNGIGIPENQRETVFLMFQRLHSLEEFPGTGMGLCLCRRILHRHQGKIWVESNPNGGTVVCFSLPKS